MDTRAIARVRNTFKGVVEGAFGYGPFSLQGEYFHSWVERRGLGTLNFSGWYAYGSWLLSGESRPIVPKAAISTTSRQNTAGEPGSWGCATAPWT